MSFTVRKADLNSLVDQRIVLLLLNAYSCDPMGNGKPLADTVRENLVAALRKHPTTVIFLARDDTGQSVGIATCFRGFSTFAAQPLLNIHDVYVMPEQRGAGVASLLFDAIENEARATGCCKLTLEVFEQNHRAQEIYRGMGFSRPASSGNDLGEMFFLAKVLH